VASGRTEIIDVSKTPVLHLNGNLTDQGTIELVSTNPEFPEFWGHRTLFVVVGFQRSRFGVSRYRF
jgi:hypothetical protein